MGKRKARRSGASAPPKRVLAAAESSSSNSLSIVICLLLTLVTIIIYAQTFTHDYVAYDDDQYVYANPWVKGGLTASSTAWAFTTFFYANWHPLTWISYMLDSNLFGLNPGAQHLENVAFHLSSGLVLFLALARMTRQQWRSGLVAAIFLVHPLRVESVAWISERKDVLSTVFEMLTLLLYVRYTARLSVGRYIAMTIAFGLSLLSKPMAVTFPLVLLLLDFWPLRRFDWPLTRAALRRPLLEKTPLLALSAVAALLTFRAQHSFGAVISLTNFSLTARLANAAIAYVAYIEQAFWPSGLAVLYPARSPEPGSAIFAVLFLSAVTGVVWRWFRQRPYLAVGWFWYLGMLVPVIGIVQVGIQAMADRYTYVPMVGLSIALVWEVASLVENRQALRFAVIAGAIVLLAVLSDVAFRQVTYWKNSHTLFEHTLAVTRDNYTIENNLGVILAREGRFSDAIALYRRSLAALPDYAEARFNLGHELLRSDQLDEAQSNLARALELNPNLAGAEGDLGMLLAERGKFEESRQHLERALAADSGDAFGESNLCFVLTKLGRPKEAITHCNTALRINPGITNARTNLNNARAAAERAP